jgi:hypothetical protein
MVTCEIAKAVARPHSGFIDIEANNLKFCKCRKFRFLPKLCLRNRYRWFSSFRRSRANFRLQTGRQIFWWRPRNLAVNDMLGPPGHFSRETADALKIHSTFTTVCATRDSKSGWCVNRLAIEAGKLTYIKTLHDSAINCGKMLKFFTHSIGFSPHFELLYRMDISRALGDSVATIFGRLEGRRAVIHRASTGH